MAGLFNELIKGLSSLAPQDDPSVKAFNLQNELSSLKEKEEKLFAQFGRKLYNELGKDAYPEIGVQLEAIESERVAAQQKLDEALAEQKAREEAELAEQQAQEELSCPGCGKLNPAGTKFCSECGSRIETSRFCRSCGAELTPGTRFCGSCGKLVD